MVQARITKSSLWAVLRTIVFVTKFRAAGRRGSPRTRAWKKGIPPKSSYFTAIGSPRVKTVHMGTDMLLIITSTGDELYKSINIDDLEW